MPIYSVKKQAHMSSSVLELIVKFPMTSGVYYSKSQTTVVCIDSDTYLKNYYLGTCLTLHIEMV